MRGSRASRRSSRCACGAAKRDAVVEALLQRFGIAEENREKLRDRLHELEAGLLEPRCVDPPCGKCWGSCWCERASARLLATEGGVNVAYYRMADVPTSSPDRREEAADAVEVDEVDQLFGTLPK